MELSFSSRFSIPSKDPTILVFQFYPKWSLGINDQMTNHDAAKEWLRNLGYPGMRFTLRVYHHIFGLAFRYLYGCGKGLLDFTPYIVFLTTESHGSAKRR